MKAVCLLSGGMDSSTLAYLAKSKGYDILALHLNYGQRTERKELICAKKIASLLNAEAFIEINLDYFTKFGASSLTDKEIAVEEFDPARAHIPNTYVPFRNANLLAIATSFAEARVLRPSSSESSHSIIVDILTAARSLSKHSRK